MALMLQLSMVALGGAAGAVCRYALAGHFIGKMFTDAEHPRFPWGVLAVNLLGCLAVGILAAAFIDRPTEDRLRFLLITGFLGSFTTFSAFGLDTFELLKANAVGLALANVAASVIGGTALAAAGWFITQRIITP
ncbi:MAG: fluoride efflux transporter CrcB [Planctomycetota bacterium]